MRVSVYDVREGLLELARRGDDCCGGEWSDCEKWHAEVVAYVRSALGDGPADDVASRLRVTRGATQAEKESNAIGFVKDWLSTQAASLTDDKIVPTFDGKVPKAAKPIASKPEAVPEAVSAKPKEPEKDKTHGDVGPKA